MVLIFLSILLQTFPAQADICKSWLPPQITGYLNSSLINEASGIAISRQFPNRMYHHNDSGDGPFFYVSEMDGSHTFAVEVAGMKPIDVEDMSLGPCGTEECIFLADIGDNDKERLNIDLWALPELQDFGLQARVWKHLKLTYPDKAHNAEAFTIDPSTGDAFILTKEAKHNYSEAFPARLYRVRGALIARAHNSLVMEFIGEIDVPFLNGDSDIFGQVVTSMDFSAAGDRLIILTYANAIEIRGDLLRRSNNSHDWVEGVDFARIPLTVLQQEAIAYSPDGKSFFYDAETDENEKDVPIFEVKCNE